MTVGEICEILDGYRDDMRVRFSNVRSGDRLRAELRDFVDWNTGELTGTELVVVPIWDYPNIGLPHLTDDERSSQRRTILARLGTNPTGGFGGHDCFTAIHGDWRIYHNNFGSQDTCYGSKYDPRVFLELAEEGLLAISGQGSNRWVTVTDAGRQAAIAEKLLDK